MRLVPPTLVLAALLTASASAGAAVVADFATDFSFATNPSGAWSYGRMSTLGGPFVASTATITYGPIDEITAWMPAGTFWPTVALNPTASTVSFGAGNAIVVGAGEGLLHPGQFGDFADVRYVVQSDFTGTLDVTFRGIDTVGTTTDVHVLRNGVGLYSSMIDGYGSTSSYSVTLAFAAGDVIDFAVGVGSNGNYIDDSTGFTARLTTAPVPEPGTYGLLAVGLFALAAWRRREART